MSTRVGSSFSCARTIPPDPPSFEEEEEEEEEEISFGTLGADAGRAVDRRGFQRVSTTEAEGEEGRFLVSADECDGGVAPGGGGGRTFGERCGPLLWGDDVEPLSKKQRATLRRLYLVAWAAVVVLAAVSVGISVRIRMTDSGDGGSGEGPEPNASDTEFPPTASSPTASSSPTNNLETGTATAVPAAVSLGVPSSRPVRIEPRPPLFTDAPGVSTVAPTKAPPTADVSSTGVPSSVGAADSTLRPTPPPFVDFPTMIGGETLVPSNPLTSFPIHLSTDPCPPPSSTPAPTEEMPAVPLEKSPAPSAAAVSPRPLPSTREEQIAEAVASAGGGAVLTNDPGSPERAALDWLSGDGDPSAPRDPSDPRLLQRYGLAVLYFSTTDRGGGGGGGTAGEERSGVAGRGRGWAACGAPSFSRGGGACPAGDGARWLSGSDECDWYGVVCGDDGAVNSVNLKGNGLSGPVPSGIFLLSNLRKLILSKNFLSSSIPNEMAKLQSLETLLLNGNDLSSTIPPSLGDLPNLKFLAIGNNDLRGNLPREILTAHLEKLSVTNNTLEGNPPEMSAAVSLIDIDLSRNNFIGEIPHFRELRHLTSLNLGHNKLQGTLPSFRANPKLEVVNLKVNMLHGTIPDDIFADSIAPEVTLDINHNLIEGVFPYLNIKNVSVETVNNTLETVDERICANLDWNYGFFGIFGPRKTCIRRQGVLYFVRQINGHPR